VATLVIQFTGSDESKAALQSVTIGLDDVGDAADEASEKGTGFFSGMLQSAGGFLAANVIGAIGSQFSDLVGSAFEDARGANLLMAATETVIKSTGSAAGLTAEEIASMASEMSDAAGKSPFGDDLIQEGQNVLLTFTNIGKEVFPLATQASLDMATALHKTPEAMSMMLGKALNTAEGFTALKKSGVAFTESQEDQIKALFASGNAVEAQKIILKELEVQFGGQAEAAAAASGGMVQFKARLGEMGESVAAQVLPVIDQFAGFLNDKVLPVVEELVADAIPALTGAWESIQPVISTVTGTIQGFLRAFDNGPLVAFINTVYKLFPADVAGEITDGLLSVRETFDGLVEIFERGDGVLSTVINSLYKIFPPDVAGAITDGLMGAREAVDGLIVTFSDAANPVEGLLDVLSEVSPTFEILRGIVESALPPIQSIVESVFGIISGFIEEKGEKIVGDVTGVWQQVQSLIDEVLPPIQQVVSTVFGVIATFLENNGDEIKGFLGETWDQIATIISTAVELIQAIIVPIFTTVADFISAHSEEILGILSGVWTVIEGVIQVTLSVIKGVIATTLALIQGDWDGVWEAVKTMFSGVWEGIQQILSGALTILQNELSMAWDAVNQLTDDALNGLVETITGLPEQVAGVGQAAVDMIWDGMKAKWDELLNWWNDQLQAVRDTLPFSDPKDSSSPLYGLSKSGESIISQILFGMTAKAGELAGTMADIGEDGLLSLIEAMDEGIPALQNAVDLMTEAMLDSVENAEPKAKKQMEDLVDEVVAAAARLPDLIADATAGMFDIQAGTARTEERNLRSLDQFSGQQRETIKDQLAKAELEAGKIEDPEEAAAFFKKRSDQIFELAKLQKEMNEAGGTEAEQLAKERADLERQLLDETDAAKRAALEQEIALNEDAQRQNEANAADERARYAERIELIKEAQAAELDALKTRQEQEKSQFEELAATAQTIFQVDIPSEFLEMLSDFEELFAQFSQAAPTEGTYIPQPGGQPGSGFRAGGVPATQMTFHIDARGSTMSTTEYERIVRKVVNESADAAEVRRRTR